MLFRSIAVIRSAMARPPVLGSTLSPNFTGCVMVLSSSVLPPPSAPFCWMSPGLPRGSDAFDATVVNHQIVPVQRRSPATRWAGATVTVKGRSAVKSPGVFAARA